MLEKRLKIKARRFLICLIIAAAAVVFVLLFSVVELKKTMDTESEKYLTETTSHACAFIDSKMDTTFLGLKSIYNTYFEMEKEYQKPYLAQKAQELSYNQIILFDRNGQGFSTLGNAVDVSEYPIYQRAKLGANFVERTDDFLQEEESIAYCVPIRAKTGEFLGAIVALMSEQKMVSALEIEGLMKDGFCILIDKNGDFVVKMEESSIYKKENLFEYLLSKGTSQTSLKISAMKQTLEEGKSGRIFFMPENDENHHWKDRIIVSYAPLKQGDWYLVLFLPHWEAAGATDYLILMICCVNCGIILLFLGLISITLWIQYKSRKSLEELAFVDTVTGGYSRQKFEWEAVEKIKHTPPSAYAIVSMDIINFKLINDSFGSQEGNRTLKFVHDQIAASLQAGEIVARTTADTFYLLIKNAAQEEITSRLMYMVEQINSFNDTLIQKYFLTIAIGVYTIDEPELSMITIQDRANVARKNGKNAAHKHRLSTLSFYSDTERRKMIWEKEIDNRMETALEQEEFIVYLQPKYDLIHQRIVGAEALVRWIEPQKGFITPGEFIPVFEKNGFIVKLDYYVFEQVLKLLRKWIDQGKEPVRISVNLSRAHFGTPGFFEQYVKVWEKYQVPPQFIEIEITESMAYENMELLAQVVDEIHKVGFSCSLDDFGSGYSSLNILKDLPVDVLKLDKEFFTVRQGNFARSEYVVESVIGLAKRLSMKTVSEGVETMEQVEFLKQAGCDMVQGFVFSKPLPITQFEQLAFSRQ